MLFSCLGRGCNSPLFIMEKTVYAISRFGSLIFNVGDHAVIDGVRPIDVDSLRYIRQSIHYGSVTREIQIIHSQLIFTNVRNG